jgi:hypothetical protein
MNRYYRLRVQSRRTLELLEHRDAPATGLNPTRLTGQAVRYRPRAIVRSDSRLK